MNKVLFSLSWLGMALFIPFLISCDTDRIFEEHHGIKNQSWAIEDTVSFQVSNADEANVLSTLHIRYNDDYDYHNLYVRYFLKDSLGNTLENKLLDLLLFEPKSGKPLGKGFGSSYTQLDTIPLFKLPEKGKFKVQFVQYMRSKDLNGVESVGLKITEEK